MSFFISDAIAQTTTAAVSAATPASGQAANGNPMLSTVLLLVLFGLFVYFFIWRPQSKRMKAHQTMTDALKVGDEIVTSGGVLGKVAQIEGTIIDLTVAPNVQMKIQKMAVASVLPKGTIKV